METFDTYRFQNSTRRSYRNSLSRPSAVGAISELSRCDNSCIYGMSITVDSNCIESSSEDGDERLWDASNGNPSGLSLPEHREMVTDVAAS